ncbi:32680_t:CDS:2 [Racocetra persica]|uniref:32680_t:CDS:1 n=1 Tax=Racocetra persica TaxID=160502 RepID=A0ACA9Q8L6_9GLOM|nr:32680_t:CDS:2 [Racocetra persica]
MSFFLRLLTRSRHTLNKRLLSSNKEFTDHGKFDTPPKGEGVTINFITQEGDKKTIVANEGESIMDISHTRDEIELESPEYYKKLEEPTDEENDMLDLAFGLTETSRLGCQIVMRKDLDGITVTIPSATRNVQLKGDDLNNSIIDKNEFIKLKYYKTNGKIYLYLKSVDYRLFYLI